MLYKWSTDEPQHGRSMHSRYGKHGPSLPAVDTVHHSGSAVSTKFHIYRQVCQHLIMEVQRRKFNYRWRGFQIPASLPITELVGVRKCIPPPKTCSNIPMDRQLHIVTKLLKVGCLPYAVGKQPSIPLINLERTWTLNWWWWRYTSIW